MQDFCPNCGNKDIERISATEIYCAPCDKTFIETKGKKIKAQAPNRIEQIEENVKGIKEVVGKIVETLKPKPKGENEEFPWGEKKE